VFESEIERIVQQCNSAIVSRLFVLLPHFYCVSQKEKNDIFSKAKELDDYCNQIEKQLELTSNELEKYRNESDVLALQVRLSLFFSCFSFCYLE
jgi:hypothetical protein